MMRKKEHAVSIGYIGFYSIVSKLGLDNVMRFLVGKLNTSFSVYKVFQ